MFKRKAKNINTYLISSKLFHGLIFQYSVHVEFKNIQSVVVNNLLFSIPIKARLY